ncbi:hypothetical protein GQX74_014441 [Glossina fuscipes]|nr:hypothetical protein GQX74_014441 [Glossina fuscipes]
MKNFSSKLDEKICEIYFFLPAKGITSGFVLIDALVINPHTRLTYSKSYPRRYSTLFLHSDTKVSDGGSESKIYEGKRNSVEHNTKTWKIFIRRATSFKYFFHCCTSLLIDKKRAKRPFPKAKNDNMMKSSTLTTKVRSETFLGMQIMKRLEQIGFPNNHKVALRTVNHKRKSIDIPTRKRSNLREISRLIKRKGSNEKSVYHESAKK